MFKSINLIFVFMFSIFSSDLNDKKFKKATISIYDISINDINGVKLNLNDYKGKYILFVNVASKCGFTKQYKDLQKLYDENSDKLVVIGFPCNQFGLQEPGSEKQISIFCSEKYKVSFPMTEKIYVKGPNQHKIYKWLTSRDLNGRKSSNVKWNFQKYLVGPDGNLVDYWYSLTNPMSSKITNYLK